MSSQQLFKEWIHEGNLDEKLKAELKDLAEDSQKLEDTFYALLEFGTAGMRGTLGSGINPMNISTVRQATPEVSFVARNL